MGACAPVRPVAQAALRQKKAYENELDRIAGTRMTLETQVNAIESANMNLETMTAMRKGADALRNIHGSLNIDKVDSTMDSIREQMDLTNEISDAISNPVGMGHDIDEVSNIPFSLVFFYFRSPVDLKSDRTISRTSWKSWNRRSSTSVSWAPITSQPIHQLLPTRPARVASMERPADGNRSPKTTTTQSSRHCKQSWQCRIVHFLDGPFSISPPSVRISLP